MYKFISYHFWYYPGKFVINLQKNENDPAAGRKTTRWVDIKLLCAYQVNRKKITVYIDHIDDGSDFKFMCAWLKKWKSSVHIEEYSSGGWEHVWDIEAPNNAVEELPKNWLCASKWAGIGSE